MFCEECGTKNRKNANFCKECGVRLKKNELVKAEESEKEEKKSKNKPNYKEIKPKKKPLSKKKVLIILLIIILIILISASLIFAHNLKPKSVAEKYFVALLNDDEDEIYKYLGVENQGLTSKKIFQEVYDNEDENLLNYKVTSESISSSGLEASVVIEYTLEDNGRTAEKTIELVKDKKNKLLFFDNWIIDNKSSIVVYNNHLRVPKDATVKLEDVVIDKSYIEKDSDKEYDNYVIPQMFKGEYDVIVTLENGIVLTNDVKIGGSGVTNLLSLKASDTVKNALEKTLPTMIDSLYASAIADKSFGEISEDYEYKGGILDSLEASYNSFQKSLSNDLQKFKVTEVSIISCEVTNEGYLNVETEVEYDYTVKYTFFGNEETKNKDSEDKMNFVFDYSKNEYKLVDIDSLTTYFSRY